MRRGRARWRTVATRGRVLIRAFVTILAAATAHSTANAEPQQAAPAPRITASALAQIESLIAEKDSRSPVEQKIDSQLIYELKMRSGQAIAAGVARVETDVPYALDGHAIVDVTARQGSDLGPALASLGAELLSASADRTSLRIHIPIERIEALASQADVLFVQPRQDAKISQQIVAQPSQTNITGTNTGQGSRTSEGDIAHLAFAARAAFGARGAGIKIGVLSDGVASLAQSQALGDLGPVTVLPGQAGSGDEGTAMLEIIHDLAPEAPLFFATGITSITTFADNIRNLRAAGCDVIVDDVFYFVESPFHDGQAPNVISPRNQGRVTQAVNDVIASGALYFTSAGNSGSLDAGTSGTWEGNFADGGPNGIYRLHDFGGGQVVNVITVASTNPTSLYWSDPLGSAPNDYDLFRLSAAGDAILASSTNIQRVGIVEDPYEQMSGAGSQPGQLIVVAKRTLSGSRFLHLDLNGGRLSIATAGQLHGHAQASAAFAVAATPALVPFPSPFNAGNIVEAFSSDGPRRVFFRADNTPYTPADLLATGGQLRRKPDITAADGVQVTGLGGVGSPFFGTSAAAPHAAAIAALIKSINPALTADALRTALLTTAIDIQAPGFDRDSGAGIIVATEALRSLGAAAPALVEIERVDANDNPGNNNGIPEAGEGARLSIPLANYGNAPATGITTSITTSTPGITIVEPSTRSYDDIAPSGASIAAPILFTVASDFPCPRSAAFALTVNYAGGASPRVFEFEVPIGVSSFRISKRLDGTTPPTAPGVTTSTDVQASRLNRDGIQSTCGVQKPTPPVFLDPSGASTNRQFDAYAFNTCQVSVPSCVTVNVQGNDAVNLFAAAYSPTFSPVDVRNNYRADSGASSLFRTFSFDHPGAGQPFAIDVHDVAPAAPSGTPYTLTVTGACMGACDPPNHVPVAKATDVTVAAPANACGAAASIDDGSFDPDGDALEITQSPPGPYGIGTTEVLLTVKDPTGAISQARARVIVVDNTPPQLTCPAPITVSAAPGACGAPVSFTPVATDTCSSPVTVASTPASGSVFPVGTTTVFTTAIDAAGNTATCPLIVTVLDKEPPAINNLVLTPKPSSVSGDFVDVTVDYTLADNCSTGSCVLSVAGGAPRSGTEASIVGSTVRDALDGINFIIVDAHHVRLNADRTGKGNSRTYTVTVTCTDASGNSTVKSASITVQRGS